jgi:hypothetical protein
MFLQWSVFFPIRWKPKHVIVGLLEAHYMIGATMAMKKILNKLGSDKRSWPISRTKAPICKLEQWLLIQLCYVVTLTWLNHLMTFVLIMQYSNYVNMPLLMTRCVANSLGGLPWVQCCMSTSLWIYLSKFFFSCLLFFSKLFCDYLTLLIFWFSRWLSMDTKLHFHSLVNFSI